MGLCLCHQVSCFFSKAFIRYLALGIRPLGTCRNQCMPAGVWCLQQTASHPIQCGVINPYHSFLCTELYLKSLKECLLLKPNSVNSNRDCVLTTMYLCGSEWSALLRSFWKNAAHVRTRGFKTVYMCKWILLQNLVFILRFWLKNIINTVYFVTPFTCEAI